MQTRKNHPINSQTSNWRDLNQICCQIWNQNEVDRNSLPRTTNSKTWARTSSKAYAVIETPRRTIHSNIRDRWTGCPSIASNSSQDMSALKTSRWISKTRGHRGAWAPHQTWKTRTRQTSPTSHQLPRASHASAESTNAKTRCSRTSRASSKTTKETI